MLRLRPGSLWSLGSDLHLAGLHVDIRSLGSWGRGHYHLWGDPEPDLVLWALDLSARLIYQQGFEERAPSTHHPGGQTDS